MLNLSIAATITTIAAKATTISAKAATITTKETTIAAKQACSSARCIRVGNHGVVALTVPSAAPAGTIAGWTREQGTKSQATEKAPSSRHHRIDTGLRVCTSII